MEWSAHWLVTHGGGLFSPHLRFVVILDLIEDPSKAKVR